MSTEQVDPTPVETDTNTYGFDERDVKYLTARAVPLELAYQEELESVTKEVANDRRKLYRMGEHSSGGLWIRYHATMEGESHCARLRYWDPPSKDKKFTSSAGTAIPYIAKAVLKVAEDATVPLFFDEGPVKALAAIAAGFMAIGMGGVESAFFDKAHKDSTKEYILQQLLKENFKFEGRPVYINYDAGRVNNPCVARGEANLGKVLRGAGAVVKLIQLPLDDNGDDWGPDDFLAKRGKAEFQKLVDAAIESDPVMRASGCSTKKEALAVLKDLPFLGALHVSGKEIQASIEDDWKNRLAVNKGDFQDALKEFDKLIKRHMKEHPHPGRNSTAKEDDRPAITIGTDTHITVRETLAALKSVKGIYCRAGELVSIFHIDQSKYSIYPIELSNLVAIYMSKAAKWERWDSRAKSMVGAKPSVEVGRAIMEMRNWGNAIRVLRGITTVPLMRPDGSILQQPGYDVAMKLFYVPCIQVPEIPEHPTLEDAKRAKRTLLDLLHDFPIVGSGRSTWLAVLLTHFGREMFKGPTPAIVFGANSPRIGKTLLAKMINAIAEGDNLACRSYPDNEEEVRKTILSILAAISRLVLFDNWSQNHAFGDSVIDALLTSDVYSGRKLGVTEDLGFPNRHQWMISGVNPEVRGDTAARVLYCNIQTEDPHPELRDPKKFKYPRVEQYCHEHRAELITAVLSARAKIMEPSKAIWAANQALVVAQ